VKPVTKNKKPVVCLGIDTSLGVIDIVAVAAAGSSTVAKEDKRIRKIAEEYRTGKTWPFHLETELADAVTTVIGKLNNKPEAVAINLGPGSYTSLRSGLAFLKGWYLAEKAKTGKEPFVIVGVNGLSALAQLAGFEVFQEERNNRYWRLIKSKKGDPAAKVELIEKNATVPTESGQALSKNAAIRMLPKVSSYVNIGKRKYRMGEIIASAGIKSYTEKALQKQDTLKPIYAKMR